MRVLCIAIIHSSVELSLEIASLRGSAFELFFQIFKGNLMVLNARSKLLLVPFSLLVLFHYSDPLRFDFFVALHTIDT